VIDHHASTTTANHSFHQEQHSCRETSPTKTSSLSRTKSDYTPKFQTSFDPADHSSQQQQQQQVNQQPPRITGSKGLITAISQNRKQQSTTEQQLNINTNTIVVSSQNSSSSSIVGMKIGGTPGDSPASNHFNKYVGSDGIPTRSSNFSDGKPPQSPHNKGKNQQTTQALSKDFEIDNDVALQQLLTNAIEKARSTDSNASEAYNRPGRAESNDSDALGSATSAAMTIDSKTGQKKRRPTVKGLVKRVNSLFRTASQQKVEFEGETIISEQNLTKAQLTFVQDKKMSFIEKKIDQHTTIVTNTPVLKQQGQQSNELDFSYIDHIDDVSSVASDEHHHHHHNQASIEPSPMSSLTNSLTQQQMISTSEEINRSSDKYQSSSSQHDSTRVISKKMSIKGLIRKTSSIFQKITGTSGPEVPPRPDLPPLTSTPSSDKKMGGIAIQSDSFDIPVVNKEDSLRSLSTKSNHHSDKAGPPTFPSSSKRMSDLSLPVETASLGTVDKIIQQQLRTSSQQSKVSLQLKESHDGGEDDEEDRLSMITDDKFDPNAPNKPKKFKPVKFLKKTFTSMSKMI
jgi:hypothetical protein